MIFFRKCLEGMIFSHIFALEFQRRFNETLAKSTFPMNKFDCSPF